MHNELLAGLWPVYIHSKPGLDKLVACIRLRGDEGWSVQLACQNRDDDELDQEYTPT